VTTVPGSGCNTTISALDRLNDVITQAAVFLVVDAGNAAFPDLTVANAIAKATNPISSMTAAATARPSF
jgi:hypothetical protein